MTQQQQLDALDNQLQALQLRKEGKSYVFIAQQLGYKDHSGAWRAVRSAMKKTLKEPADEMRKLELERLDDMLSAIAPAVKEGNLAAIDRALKIQDRRAKLMGLDMPALVDVTSKGEKIDSVEVYANIIAKLGLDEQPAENPTDTEPVTP